jgi:heme/copper-type cytochrome/quinol oxidase subunit 2
MGGAVKKLLSVVTLFLMSCGLAFAATREMEGATAPADTVDVIYVVIFVVIFITSIIGFFVYLFLNEKKQKPDQ